MAEQLLITLVYAPAPRQVLECALSVAAGSTVQDAIAASGWLQLAYQSLIPFVSIAPQMLLGFVAAGVLFGMVGSFIFVGKYLKV